MKTSEKIKSLHNSVGTSLDGPPFKDVGTWLCLESSRICCVRVRQECLLSSHINSIKWDQSLGGSSGPVLMPHYSTWPLLLPHQLSPSFDVYYHFVILY